MISLNKLLMSVVVIATVVVKAEETAKAEAVAQENTMYTGFKKLFKSVTSQENIDTAKDYTNKAIEQVVKVSAQYPMYVPAAFFAGAAWSEHRKTNKFANTSHYEKATKLSQKSFVNMFKNGARKNAVISTLFVGAHGYHNYDFQFTQKKTIIKNENPVANKQQSALPTEKNEAAI
jgi:hypothetical protein